MPGASFALLRSVSANQASISGPTGFPFFAPLAYFTIGPKCLRHAVAQLAIARAEIAGARGGAVVRSGRRAGLKILVAGKRLRNQTRADDLPGAVEDQAPLRFLGKRNVCRSPATPEDKARSKSAN